MTCQHGHLPWDGQTGCSICGWFAYNQRTSANPRLTSTDLADVPRTKVGLAYVAQAGGPGVMSLRREAVMDIEAEATEYLRGALLHLATRRHAFTEDCDACLNVQAQVAAALDWVDDH